MTARVLFTLALLSSTAMAQTYPSPTYQGLTLQSDPVAANQAVRKGYLDQRLGSAVQAAGGDGSNIVVTPGGGTVARSLASLEGDTVNVLSYGAKCDGTTDDTAAVRAAFAAAAAVPNGAVLTVPQRSCLISGAVTQSIGANRAIRLQGAGGSSGFVSATGAGFAITLTDATATFDASDVAFLRTGSGQSGIGLSVQATAVQAQSISHFRNLLFSGTAVTGGTASWQEGLKLISLSAPVVDGMRSFMPDGTGNGSGYGLHLTGSDVSHFLGDAKVVNSLFQGGQATIKVDGAVQGVYVANSEGIGSDYGIYAADPAGDQYEELLTVTNSHWNNALAGIYMQNFNENQISNNLFLHFSPAAGRAYQAIFADHSGYTTVTGNTFLGTGQGLETFFKATGAQLYAVTGNNAITIAGQCIDTAGSSNVSVTGNSCQGVYEPGITLGATSFASANIVNGRNELVGPGGGAALVKGGQTNSGGFLALSAQSTLAATGTGQSDAAAIGANQVFVSGVPAGSGVRLPLTTTLAAGSATSIEVWNSGTGAVLVYPAAGETLLGGAANAPISLPGGGQEQCWWPGQGTAWLCSGATNLVPLARLASPALSGVPTAPTAALGTSTAQLATTAFVAAALPSPAFQLVTASGAFTPATASSWVRFRLFGPGGAGGAGFTCAAGASCGGGGGGGAGGMTDFWIPAARIPAGGCTITVGSAGTSNTVVSCGTGLSKTAYRGGAGAAGSASGAGGGGGGGEVGYGRDASGVTTGLSNPYPNTSSSGTPLTVSSGGTSGATGACVRGADSNLGPTGGGGGAGLNAGAAVAVVNCGGGENPMSGGQAPIITDTGCEPNVGGASGVASTSAAAGAGGAGGTPGGGGGGGGSGTVSGGTSGAGGAGRVCIWQG